MGFGDVKRRLARSDCGKVGANVVVLVASKVWDDFEVARA